MKNKEIDFEKLESVIGAHFKDRNILREACTHRSYLNENKSCDWNHNERLEFLGDAVLELAVTDYLFKKYTDKNEGDLTSFRAALVNTTSLSESGSNIGINDFLLLSKGEAKDTGKARQYILANAIEAIIGAIYLDNGYDGARDFIAKILFPKLDEIIEKGLWKDAKSLFQEIAQEKANFTPAYKVLKEEGPDHDKEFTVGVFLADDLIAEGIGKSKQEAEQNAAQKALEKKDWGARSHLKNNG